jgi:uncharacterized protein (DUF488 family)
VKASKKDVPAILTVGHSTRGLDEFLHLLTSHKVKLIVDVRTVPRSRHNPQFNRETLPEALKSAGVSYLHLPGLGGLRHAKKDSPNTGWRNESFRGFADYMGTEDFAINIDRLISLAREKRLAIMCAEAVPWRCHRSLIADALQVRGIRVQHIMSETATRPHEMTSFAVVSGLSITYPAAESSGRLSSPALEGRKIEEPRGKTTGNHRLRGGVR